MKINRAVVIIACILCLAVAGCGAYYTSSKIYYTDGIKQKKGGAIEFKDSNTGSTVTLPSSEVLTINKEEFKANTPKK
jgi:hypothetical protein